MSGTEGPPKEENESLQFADRLLHTPPEDRQLDDISTFLELFSLQALNFENIQLAVKNKHYVSDIKELHRLVAHHMQFVQYLQPHRELKHKDSCKFQCSIILEGSVKVFDWRDREETKELLHLQAGDIILDKHILKTLQRPIMFVYADNTSIGVAKYEDFQETLFSSVEEKEDQKIISSFRLFQSLPLFSFENLCLQFTLKNCIKGESIFEINDPVKAIYIIKNGEFIMEEEVTFKQGIKQNPNGSVDDETPHNHSTSEDITELSVQQIARKKKESRKSMGTRVLLAGELFGDDDIIEEFCSRENRECVNQEISKKIQSPQGIRKCSVKCLSIKAQLLILPSNELIHRVLEKLKPGVLKNLQAHSQKKKAIYAKSVNKIRKSVLPYTNYLLPQTPNSLTPSNSPRLAANNFTIQSQFISNKMRKYQKYKKQNSKSLNHSSSNNNNQSSKSPSQLQKQQQQLLKQHTPFDCSDSKMKTNYSMIPTTSAASHFEEIKEDNNLKLQKITFNSANSIPLVLQCTSPLSANNALLNLPFPIVQGSSTAATTSLAFLPACDDIEQDHQITNSYNTKSKLEIPDNKSPTLHPLPSDNLIKNLNNNYLDDSHQQCPARRTKSFSHFDLRQPSIHKDSNIFLKQLEKTENQSQTNSLIQEAPLEDASFASQKKSSSSKIILQFQRSSSKISSKKPSSSLNSSIIWQSKNTSAIGSAVEYGSILGSCSAITMAPSPLAKNNSSKNNFGSHRILSARKLMQNEPSQFIKYVPLAETIKKKVGFQEDQQKQQLLLKNLAQKSQDPTKQKQQYNISQPQSRDNNNSQKPSETAVTYAGLGSKLENEVGDRSMKIKLLTPIFSRGYKENFIKEMANLNRRNRKPNYIVEFKQDNSRRLDQQNKLIHSLLKNNTKSALFSNNINNNTSNNIFSIPNHLNMKAIINNSNQQQISQQIAQPYPQHNPSLLISTVPQTPDTQPAQEQSIPEIQLFSHSILNNSFQRKQASSLPSSPIRLSSPSSPLKPSNVQLPINLQLIQSSSQPSSPQSKQYPSYYLVNGTQYSKQQVQQSQQLQKQKAQFPFSMDSGQQFLPSSRGNGTQEYTPQNNPSPCNHYYSRGFQGSKKTLQSCEISNITNNNSPQFRSSLQPTDRKPQVLKRRSCEPVERQQQKLEKGQQLYSQYKQISQKSQPVSPFFRKRPPPLSMMEITTAVHVC